MRFGCYVALALLSDPCVRAASLSQTADIRTYLNAIPVPGRDSEGFIAPSGADIAAWRPAVDALLTGQFTQAAALADPSTKRGRGRD